MAELTYIDSQDFTWEVETTQPITLDAGSIVVDALNKFIDTLQLDIAPTGKSVTVWSISKRDPSSPHFGDYLEILKVPLDDLFNVDPEYWDRDELLDLADAVERIGPKLREIATRCRA